jgi:hypothetical protein
MKWLLILFPRNLYWIDCCEYPHIGRVGMDGTNQSVVIETKISRPMALTIDYVNHRLYWADENHIEFSNMDGSHRHKGWSNSINKSGFSSAENTNLNIFYQTYFLI